MKEKQKIPGVKNIIMVCSAKGGVGKSTIAASLAVDLSKQGFKIGLLDADIYGPSLPRIFNILEKPTITNTKIDPIEKDNIKIMSIGFLIDEKKAAIWRGPMVVKSLYQLMGGVNWRELDLLIIDMPPGTGDIYLSLNSNYNIDGAILVTINNILSLIDAQKTLNMLGLMQINVLGMVVNMSNIFKNDDTKDFFKDENFVFNEEVSFDNNISNNNLILSSNFIQKISKKIIDIVIKRGVK